MNFAKSFTYIFEDPDWFSKLWKPVLIGLIPIVGLLVLQGYMLNVTLQKCCSRRPKTLV